MSGEIDVLLARCSGCNRLQPIYDVEVREGPRKRFGLHSDHHGNCCRMSDRVLDPSTAEHERHLQEAFNAEAAGRDCCCGSEPNPFCKTHQPPPPKGLT